MIKSSVGFVHKSFGDIVDVYFNYGNVPAIYNVLSISIKHQEILLEVVAHLGDGIVRTIATKNIRGIQIGQKVINTLHPIKIPVGKDLLGRVVNGLGEIIDDKPITNNFTSSYINDKKHVNLINYIGFSDILHTGIKIIDLMLPCIKGSSIALIGSLKTGKTSLMLELVDSISKTYGGYSIFTQIGVRAKEVLRLYNHMNNIDLISDKDNNKSKCVLVSSKMSDTAAARAKTIITAITIAEYFRDTDRKDVFLFIDNLYRFIQAKSEISSMLGYMPVDGVYPSTLALEIGALQERITSTIDGSITSIQSISTSSDDLFDVLYTKIWNHIDTGIVFSKDISSLGIYPSIDPFASFSSFLSPDILGDYHYKIVVKVKSVLKRYKELEETIDMFGEEELSKEDQLISSRAIKILNFCSQPLYNAEQFHNLKSKKVSIEDTLSGFNAICEGDVDDVPKEAFYMVGNLDEVKEKAMLLNNE